MCFRTIFLTHFQLTECYNFVHNSMPHTHPSLILIGRDSSDCWYTYTRSNKKFNALKLVLLKLIKMATYVAPRAEEQKPSCVLHHTKRHMMSINLEKTCYASVFLLEQLSWKHMYRFHTGFHGSSVYIFLHGKRLP